jgi:hypothetical protein
VKVKILNPPVIIEVGEQEIIVQVAVSVTFPDTDPVAG